MIVAGILFLFGIVIGIQILHALFSSWFWKFVAHTIPIVSLLFTLIFAKELKHDGTFWIALAVTIILSIPMLILESKKEQPKKEGQTEAQKHSD